MSYIPLVEHTRPRILMLDFSPQDVTKVIKAGFDAHRGATGLYDNNEFYFPFSVQDAEIVFASIKRGSFTSEKRLASANSIEKQPFFKALMRETWEKHGWIVLFISHDISQKDLETIGIEGLGIIDFEHHHYPESIRASWLEVVKQISEYSIALPPPQMPIFVGQRVHLVEQEPVVKIIERYIKSAKILTMACLNVPSFIPYSPDHLSHPYAVVFGNEVAIEELVRDESVDLNVLSIKLDNSIDVGKPYREHIYNYGGILLLPDFGQNNINVALALLQETFVSISPQLFDDPQHPWLKNYLPVPVIKLQSESDVITQKAIAEIEELNRQAEVEREKYIWLVGLLVSIGDQFASDSADALKFLGFEVEEVDSTLDPKERKREDFRIEDKSTGYFALGEAKTTGKNRGASEEFITKTQGHINRFSRENNRVSPPALLIINYAIDLDPVQRTGLFYQEGVRGTLEDGGITAINSVGLFDLCQFVLREEVSKKQARHFLTSGQPMIASVTLEDLAATKQPPA